MDSTVTTTNVALAVRSMERSEARSVAMLFREILEPLPYYNQWAKAGELAKFTPDRLQTLSISDPEAALIAKIEQELVGFCFSNQDDQTIWLSWFGVSPTHRRKGIATLLLHAVENRARKLGSHKIWCDSRTNNEISGLLLDRTGYRRICVVQDHWYRQDFVLWEKPIAC